MSNRDMQRLIILLAFTVIFVILVSTSVLLDESLPLLEKVVDARAHGYRVRLLADILMVELIVFIPVLLNHEYVCGIYSTI